MHFDPLLIVNGHHLIYTQSKENKFLHNNFCLFQDDFMQTFCHSPFDTINLMFLYIVLHIWQHIQVFKVFEFCH
jgi:hypothetical protein